jgi:glucoamylase
METQEYAPGWPGIPARWTSSAKSGVGTALSPASRVWFSLSHGILNEVYYPRLDQACIRDLGMIVTADNNFFSEEKRHAVSHVTYPVAGVPLYRLTNSCKEARYRIEKEIFCDPNRDVIIQKVRFIPLIGKLEDYRLYLLLAPHLGNGGAENNASVGDYKGVPMLFAERQGNALALACSTPWLKRSVGFVGISDGWQDLMQHQCMEWAYTRADNGNVATCSEVDPAACNGEFILTLGFGRTIAEAGNLARAALLDNFAELQDTYVRSWQAWQQTLPSVKDDNGAEYPLFRVSTAVIRIHESNDFPGGMIAGLSIPWGFNKGDDDLGGYHLVWPRDLVEAAGGLLAAGACEDARRVLLYLQSTQEADGHWPQNMWLDGTPYWSGIQMDETAFPILLVDLARRTGALDGYEISSFWPMVRLAVSYIVQNGPVTQQDRWEEDAGYSPFTLAVEIAAMLAAADLAELNGAADMAVYLREAADFCNDSIEQLTYVTGTNMAKEVGVDGYYVRISPPELADAASPSQGFVPVKNRPPGQGTEPCEELISPDALALVRFGLRSADDPHIVNTVRIIDHFLKVELPSGPAWHRYNNDGYGEHEDGSPFDGTGVGRVWPLLTGERAHYELAAGRRDEALRLLKTIESYANEGGMLSEQVWDSDDIPERELFRGRPSGSAMPLVWAHAEYVKMCRSLQDGRVFDMPPQPVQRYLVEKIGSRLAVWSFNNKRQTIETGKTLRIETLAPALVQWSSDNWMTVEECASRDTGLGVHLADLETAGLSGDSQIVFTFYWPQASRWEATDFSVRIVS